MKTQLFAGIAGTVLALSLIANIAASSARRFVVVGDQWPSPVAPGNSATYTVTFDRAGTGSLPIYLDVTGLPPGATVSYAPGAVHVSDLVPSTKVAKLIISTSVTTPPGTYYFTVIAQHGQSPTIVTASGRLIVGADPPAIIQPPIITSIVRQSDGSILLIGMANSSQPIYVQATFDLAVPSWQTIGTTTTGVTGIFSFIDVDAAKYPMRFYRLSLIP